VDDRGFVEGLIAALPEAFDAKERAYYLDEPLPYPALGDARIWLEDHALAGLARRRAKVRPERADAFARFWDFVEAQAACDDPDLRTLLQIECFEGVVWIDDVSEYLGPRTRALLGRWSP
jgi:hypothetical protein